MPREIIDTQSSRPAYLRRRITTFIVVAVIVLALIVGGWAYWGHHAASLVH